MENSKSHQTGIETNKVLPFLVSLAHSLNRTRLELKQRNHPPIRNRENPLNRTRLELKRYDRKDEYNLFCSKSHQTGIETN